MKNKLSDLNNYLFEQIERINDDSLSSQELETQLKKAEAITNISKTIIKNQEIQLKAAIKLADCGYLKSDQTKFLLSEVIKND